MLNGKEFNTLLHELFQLLWYLVSVLDAVNHPVGLVNELVDDGAYFAHLCIDYTI